jgi:hypothetical protein
MEWRYGLAAHKVIALEAGWQEQRFHKVLIFTLKTLWFYYGLLYPVQNQGFYYGYKRLCD